MSSPTTPLLVRFAAVQGGVEAAHVDVATPNAGTTIYSTDLTFSGADGTTTLQVTAFGIAGQLATSGVVVTADLLPPSVTTTWAGGTWTSRSGTLSVPATITDATSGLSTATMQVALTDGGTASLAGSSTGSTTTFTVPGTLGSRGKAEQLPFSITAIDKVGNAATLPAGAGRVLKLDDAAPAIATDSANPLFGSAVWHGAGGSLSAAVTAKFADVGSGVNGAVGSAPTVRLGAANAAVSAKGTLVAGGTTNDGVWTFGDVALPSDPSIETAAYPLFFNASDIAGNAASSTPITIQLDNRPPAYDLSQLKVDTAVSPYDETDAQGVGLFLGATQLPGAPGVKVVARIVEGFLAAATATLPDGTTKVTAECAPGSGDSTCAFLIARPALTGTYLLTFDAVDQAGNAVAGSKPTYALHFDNDPPAAYAAAISADSTWYKRDPAVNVAVTATLATLPASGIASVTLTPAGGTAIAPSTTSGDAKTYTFSFPASVAPVNTQGPFNVTVSVNPVASRPALSTGKRNIDGLAPAATITPPGWVGLSTASSVSLPITVSDGAGSGVASYSLLFRGKTITGISNQPFTLDALTGTPALFEGSYPLVVTATDLVGNSSSTASSLLVDLAPPTLTSFVTTAVGVPGSFTAPDGKVWLKVTGAVTADVAAVVDAGKGSPLQGVSLYAGTGACQAVASSTDVASPFHFSVPRCLGANKEGAVPLLFNAADQAGNQLAPGPFATSGQAASVYFDDVAPSAPALVSPGAAQWVARSAGVGGSTLPVTLALTESGSGVASVALSGAAATSTVNGWLASLSLAAAPPGKAQALPVAVTAIDNVGNTSTGLSVPLLVDDAAPVITVAAPSSWLGPAAAASLGLPVTVSDQGSGVSGYQLKIGAATITGINNQPFALDATSYVGALFEGPLPFQVNATDKVGNATSTTGSLLIDLAPPKLTSFVTNANASVGDYTAADNTVWLKVTGAATADVTAVLDPGLGSPTQTVSLYAGAGACQSIAATTDTASPYRFKVPRCLGAGKEGPVTLLLNAVDQAGNQLVAGDLGTTGTPVKVYFDDLAPSSATLVSPAGWVSRAAGLGASKVTVVATVVDVGSGVLSATFTPQGGQQVGARSVALGWSADLGLLSAPVGVAQGLSIGVNATDHVGNPSTSIAPLTLQVDDAAPVISADPANVIYTASSWHGAQAGSLIVPLTARITDSGSGVAPAPTAQIGAANATLLNGTFKSGTTLDGVYDFGNQTLPSDATIETNAYPLYFNAADSVGNPALTKTLTVQLDNKPPVFSPITVDTTSTPFDGVDGARQGWFLGATRAPAAPAVKVTAHIVEGFFKSATVTPAGGSPSFGACTGSGPADCTFTVARPAKSGPYLLTFDATDLASNTVAGTKPTFTLYFDDDAPASYTPVFEVDTAWYKRDPAVNLTVRVTLPKLPASGVSQMSLAPAALGPPTVSADKLTYTFSLASTVAPALVEAAFGFSATVNAVVPLMVTGTGSRYIDGVAPVISKDTGNAIYNASAWLSASSTTTGVTVTAKITDGGAGVSGVAGSTPTLKLGSSGAVVKANGSLSSGTAANGVWGFGNVSFPANVEDNAYPIYFDARDLVANVATTTPITVQLDTKPPTVGSIAVVTAYDGTDSASQGWFKGSTLTSGNISVSATVTDKYFVSSSVTPAGGSPIAGTCTGTSPSYACTYSIPRSATSGAQVLTFDALDLSGNSVVTKPTTTLYFDNSTAASYTPTISADISWYQRAAGNNVSISATLPALPASGVSTVTLTPSGGTALNPSTVSPDKKTYTFSMPTTSAPASVEAAFSFNVTVKSVVQVAANASGVRNIDGLPPVISADTGNALYDVGAWLGVGSSTTGVAVTAKVADGGAGVSAVAGSAPTVKLGSSGAAVKATGSLSTGTAANGVWSFGTVTFPADAENSAYPIYFDAKDLTGNAATSTPINVQLDTRPPTIGSTAVVTAYDGTDSSSQGWFKGSVLATGNITVSAVVTETNFASSTVTPAGGSPIIGACPGTSPSYTCTYTIPRSGTSGALVLTFDALDLAGNPVVTKPTLTLYFDNSTAASYTPTFNIDTSWYQRAAGNNISIIATLPALPASGVSTVTLTPSGGTTLNPSTVSGDKKTYTFTMPTSAAPASVEAAFSFSVTAKSVVQVSANASEARNVDGLPPVITKDTANALYTASTWLGVSNATSTLVSARIADGGAGVNNQTGNIPTVRLGSSGAPPLNSISNSGNLANAIWNFGYPTLPPNVEDNAYPLYFDAKDLVGNVATTTLFTVQLDTKPPTFGSTAVVTAYDGTDSSSQGWFKGSALAAGNITVSAVVTETNFASTKVTPAGGGAVAGTCSGSSPTYTCTYSVPRSAVSGAQVLTFDALDLAGNPAVTKPTLTLYFDNSTAASYTPTINSDTSWYPRSAGTNISVTATLPSLPASGVASVTLTPATGSAITLAGTTSTTYGFSLPTTAAAAGLEGPFSFNVAVKSVVQQTATTSGLSRNIDDVAPVIQNVSVSYPAKDTTTPLQFSHDGSRFNLREGPVSVLTFKGYDCGSGAVTSSGQAAVTGIAASVSAPGTDTGSTGSCSNGSAPKVFSYLVAFDPAAISRSALTAEDTALAIGLSLSDGLVHTGSLATSVNFTRRLWQSASVGVTQLALGPKLFGFGSSSLVAVDKVTGGASTWDSAAGIESLAVGGTSASPLVYWMANNTLKSSPAGQANPTISSCSLVPGGDINPADEGLIIRDTSSALATSDSTLETYGRFYDCSACVGTPLNNCTNNCGGVSLCGACNVSCGRYSGPDPSNVCSSTAHRTTTSLTGGTCATVASAPVSTSAAIYSARLFSLNPSGAITETPVTGGTLSNSNVSNPPASSMAVLQTGAGQQLFLSNGQRWDFSSGGIWSTSVQASGFGWPLSAGKGTDGTAYTVSRSAGKFVVQNTAGGTLGSLGFVGGTAAPMVDAAGTAFLTDRTALGQVEGLAFSSSGWGAAKMPSHTFSAVINDLVVDSSGTLYVAAGGVIYTLVTDSPGLGTDPSAGVNGLGWPARGRDACRSQNLSFTCPW